MDDYQYQNILKAKQKLEYVLAHWTDPGTYSEVDEARGLLNEVV